MPTVIVALLLCAVACRGSGPPPRLGSRANIELPAERRATLHTDGSLATAACYSRSGRHVAVVGATNEVRVWDVATAKQVGTIAGAGHLVSAGRDDDTFVIYHVSSWTFTVWNWRTGAARTFSAYDALKAFPATANASTLAIIAQVVVSPDGARLLTIDEHASGLVVWNLETGTPERFIPTRVNAVAFLPEGGHAVAAGAQLSVVDLATGAMRTLRDEAYDDVAVTSDGKRVVAARGFATTTAPTSLVHVLALPEGTPLRTIAIEPTQWLYAHAGMALTADGSKLLVTTGVKSPQRRRENQAILFDVANGTTLRTFNETLSTLKDDPTRAISSVALAPDGSSLVIGYREIALY